MTWTKMTTNKRRDLKGLDSKFILVLLSCARLLVDVSWPHPAEQPEVVIGPRAAVNCQLAIVLQFHEEHAHHRPRLGRPQHLPFDRAATTRMHRQVRVRLWYRARRVSQLREEPGDRYCVSGRVGSRTWSERKYAPTSPDVRDDQTALATAPPSSFL